MTLQMTAPHRAEHDLRPAKPTVQCPNHGVDERLDGRVISAHRTSTGVVRYLRCPCGALVTWLPGRIPRHAPPSEPLLRH